MKSQTSRIYMGHLRAHCSQFVITSPCGDMIRSREHRELTRTQGFSGSYQIPANRELAGKLIGNAAPMPLTAAAVRTLLR